MATLSALEIFNAIIVTGDPIREASQKYEKILMLSTKQISCSSWLLQMSDVHKKATIKCTCIPLASQPP